VVAPFCGVLDVSEPLIVAVDIGTTAVKAALFDRTLKSLDHTQSRLESRHPHPDWVEQDADKVFEAVVDSVAELLAKADGEIVACGLDHQGESIVAWDAETRAALSPNVVWQCKRSTGILARLTEQGLAEEIERLTGMPLDPYFSASKLTWLLENVPAVADARERGTLRLGTLDAFVCDRLGAGSATDPSTASRTQLQRLGSIGWDERLLEIFGVPRESLPEVADSAGTLGTLRHERWPVALPLTARVVDQQAALAGTGCVEAGMCKATYGTGVFVLAHVGDEPPEAVGGLLPTVAWTIEGKTQYALDGGVFTAGALLEWLSGKLGLAPDPPALSALARTIEDSGGVRVLPALAGIGAPWWVPEARAVIAGLTAAAGPAHVARAAFEGIAWRVADVVETVGTQVEVGSLRVDGGMTREPLVLQLQADTAGVPVEPMEADATVQGAALLAAVGAGVLPSLAEAAELVAPGSRVEPSRDAAWRTAEHARWRRFVELAAQL
jgi:glycerol kinase